MDNLKKVQDYWNLRSHGFSDAINEELDSEQGKKWTELFETVFIERPLHILDDGAGAGFFTMLLASLGHKVTGIDYSDKMVGYVNENLARRGLKAEVLQMDAQDLKFSDASFDAVVQRNVMWNLDHPEKAYSEIFRVLKPGGILLIDDGNHYLSAHDEEYAKEAEARKAEIEELRKKEAVTPGSHYMHNPENVDFTIIEKIAVTQPLSSRRRPQWDLDVMIRLGFRKFDVKVDGTPLPHHFRIIAEKPE
ncbi:MAG: class I SAM-dependent methyltransferase [Clostridia bacterium]|nr:class I SAM-dependent methyltransferase [Clostridia bacterium]